MMMKMLDRRERRHFRQMKTTTEKPQPNLCDTSRPGTRHGLGVVMTLLLLTNITQGYKIRPSGNFSHWPAARPDLVVGPQSHPTLSSPPTTASAKSKFSMFSSSSSDMSPAKSYGMFNCMLSIHHDVTRCNNTYYQSLHHIVVRGYKRESKLYRRQFCCGFWYRERCLSDAVQRKCDRQTATKIINEKSPYGSEVDTRHTSINCMGFEQDSGLCSRATARGGRTLLTRLTGQTSVAVSVLLAVACQHFLVW